MITNRRSHAAIAATLALGAIACPRPDRETKLSRAPDTLHGPLGIFVQGDCHFDLAEFQGRTAVVYDAVDPGRPGVRVRALAEIVGTDLVPRESDAPAERESPAGDVPTPGWSPGPSDDLRCGEEVGHQGRGRWVEAARQKLPDGTVFLIGRCMSGSKAPLPGDVLFLRGSEVFLPPKPADHGWGTSLWVAGPDEAYATVRTHEHDGSLVLRFDGQTLSLIPCPIGEDLFSIAGSRTDGLWVVDERGRLFVGPDLWREIPLPPPAYPAALKADRVEIRHGELWVLASAREGHNDTLLRSGFAGKPYDCDRSRDARSALTRRGQRVDNQP
jgi:hypothetical protein